MEEINTIRRQLDDPKNLNALRADIAGLILDQLQLRQHSLRTWEKIHFLNAITALAMNVTSVQQPTTAWLRLCLVDLEKALTSQAGTKEQHQVQEVVSEDVGYEHLLASLESVMRQIGQPLIGL